MHDAGDAREDRDIDLEIEAGPSTPPWFPGGLLVELGEALCRRVDIAEEGSLHPLIRDRVLGEAIPAVTSVAQNLARFLVTPVAALPAVRDHDARARYGYRDSSESIQNRRTVRTPDRRLCLTQSRGFDTAR
jgi:hypothetical protein